MKKAFVLLLAGIIIISSIFVSCSSNKDDDSNNETTTKKAESLLTNDEEIGIEVDKNGEEVPVVYEKDKNNKTVAIKLNSNGEKVTNKNGEYVTVHTDYEITTTNAGQTTASTQNNNNNNNNDNNTGKDNIPMTSQADTTKPKENRNVPKTSATGKEVSFSEHDKGIITSMLEVPYLYLDSYENSDGVPISIACHTAVWMAEREGNIKNTYPSNSVVLNLFKYFNQTVVNFKTQCNNVNKSVNSKIKYNSQNDTFTISEFTPKKQSVTITSIEDLGGDNYYKVTGTVSGCNKRNVIAIIQKNKLDVSLGFSVMALKWS